MEFLLEAIFVFDLLDVGPIKLIIVDASTNKVAPSKK